MADASLQTTFLSLMHGMHLWVMGTFMILVAEVYSVGFMLLTRYHYGPDRLKLNNEVAGFKFAVVGVFYAVLGGVKVYQGAEFEYVLVGPFARTH